MKSNPPLGARKTINLDLVDAIEIADYPGDDETPPFRCVEVISLKGWDQPGFDEHQDKFQEQGWALLDLLGCSGGGSSEGPYSCAVEGFKDL